MVKSPAHYHGYCQARHQGEVIEVIDVIEAFDLGFNLGNVLKYVLRSRSKGHLLMDLQKAQWYLEREISNIQK